MKFFLQPVDKTLFLYNILILLPLLSLNFDFQEAKTKKMKKNEKILKKVLTIGKE